MVGAGAGQLEPGAVLLRFTPRVGLSVFLVVVSTCSTGPGPPAEPLDRQSVALSVGGRVMKGDNGGAALDNGTRGRRGLGRHDVKTTPDSCFRSSGAEPLPHTNTHCFLLTTSSAINPMASQSPNRDSNLSPGAFERFFGGGFKGYETSVSPHRFQSCPLPVCRSGYHVYSRILPHSSPTASR